MRAFHRTQPPPLEDSPAFGQIAERFRRAGELERAIALCREGLARFPDHVSPRVTLGWALLDLGRCDEARLELKAVLTRAPDNLAAIRGLAQLHDHGEAAEIDEVEEPSAPEPLVNFAIEDVMSAADPPGEVAETGWIEPVPLQLIQESPEDERSAALGAALERFLRQVGRRRMLAG